MDEATKTAAAVVLGLFITAGVMTAFIMAMENSEVSSGLRLVAANEYCKRTPPSDLVRDCKEVAARLQASRENDARDAVAKALKTQ